MMENSKLRLHKIVHYTRHQYDSMFLLITWYKSCGLKQARFSHVERHVRNLYAIHIV